MKVLRITVFVSLVCIFFGPTSTGNCAPSSSTPLFNDFEEVQAPPIRVKRIVNGTEAPKSRFPYHVAIMLVTGLSDLWNVCGGAIIAPNWILTAAHCVTDTDSENPVFVVMAGTVRSSDSRYTTYDPQLQYKIVAKVHIHSECNSSTVENDIALLWLPSALNFIPGLVEPVSVAVNEGKGNAVIAGWGQTSATIRDTAAALSRQFLRYTSVQLFSFRFCSYLLRESFQVEYDPDRMLCLMGDGTGACFGDSGSPVVNSKGSLVGIVSFGFGTNETCFIDEPTYGGRVSAYVDWIQDVCSDCLSFAQQQETSAALLPQLQNDYDFQVLITRREAEPDFEVSCTGSIIAQRWILTSESCMAQITNFTATVYVRPATKEVGEDLAPVVLVERVMSLKVEGDFGIALLYTGMEFTWAGWKSVELSREEPEAGTTAELVGWAQSPEDPEDLYYAISKISIFSNSFCKAISSIFKPETMICAMEDRDLRYCDDHLGTPVMQGGEQIGIVNGYNRSEDGECFSDFPMVLTRISVYIDWIQEVCNDCLDPITDSGGNASGFSGLSGWQLAFFHGIILIIIYL